MQRANHRVTTFIYCPDPERSSNQHLFVLNEVSPREQLLLFHHSGSEATFHFCISGPTSSLWSVLSEGAENVLLFFPAFLIFHGAGLFISHLFHITVI